MTTFTIADADAATDRLAAEHQAILDGLTQLEDHIGRRMLEGAALEGVTRRRRDEVRHGMATLWACYESYREAVVQVRTLRAQQPQPAGAELREIERLVTGTVTVTLPNPDSARAPLVKQLTLAELVSEIHTVATEVHRVVSAVDRVWAELSPRIERCHELLRDAEALAADLGLTADTDPAAALLPSLAGRLETVRRIGLTDPLQLWAGDGVEMTAAEQLAAHCEQAHADLAELGELRRHAQPHLDRITATLTAAMRLDQRALDERRQAHVKILGMPAPDPDAPVEHPLTPRLEDAHELGRRGLWRELATELPALEQEAVATLERSQAELAEAGKPLRDRAELRGRLSAYRAKAAALGRIEDLALEELAQRARDLLWSAPCDLAAAAAAVTEYQDAVNATASGARHG
jgi:hypothetical protein